MNKQKLYRIFPELRYELMLLVKKGHAISDISKEFSIPTTTLYLWRKEMINHRLTRNSEEWVRKRTECMKKIRTMAETKPRPPKKGRPPKGRLS